jgi:hypothetical protein
MYDRLKGVLPEPIGEGTHFRVPWLQNPTIMDIRTRPRSISSVTGTQGEHATSAVTILHMPALLAPQDCQMDCLVRCVPAHGGVPMHGTDFGHCPLDRSADGEHHAAGAVKAAGE